MRQLAWPTIAVAATWADPVRAANGMTGPSLGSRSPDRDIGTTVCGTVAS